MDNYESGYKTIITWLKSAGSPFIRRTNLHCLACHISISLKRRFALDGSTALSSGCQMDDWLNDSHQDAKIVIGPI